MRDHFIRLVFLALLADGCDNGNGEPGAGGSNPSDAASVDARVGVDGNGDGAEVRMVTQTVGASGGTVVAPNGVSVEIPAGALASDVSVTIDEITAAKAPDGAVSVGPTIQLGPEGLTFDEPVKVTLPWRGGDVPVVIAHSPRGGGDWTALEYDDDGSDGNHVSAFTSSFSWFQAVYYQGAPDAPIILNSVSPVGPRAVALGVSSKVSLQGIGFRTDTVVTLFKDGVATASVSPVTFTHDGLTFTVPKAFTDTVGLITIQAKNPKASMGVAAALYAIAAPVLQSVSPSSIDIVRKSGGGYYATSATTVRVGATDLPDESLGLCDVLTGLHNGSNNYSVADSGPLMGEDGGFSFVLGNIPGPGTYSVVLRCGSVWSNTKSLKFEVAATP